jgi:hypothetical protein
MCFIMTITLNKYLDYLVKLFVFVVVQFTLMIFGKNTAKVFFKYFVNKYHNLLIIRKTSRVGIS